MLNDETSFTLAFTSKKAAKLQLRAQQPLMRDLIYLLLQARAPKPVRMRVGAEREPVEAHRNASSRPCLE
eukprot:5544864-Pleurochrysis_carterae.AAC.2